MTISTLLTGQTRRVKALRLPEAEANWLRAVGLYEGVPVTVLRFAPLGGPVHVRLGTGAELAIALELAHAIDLGETVADGEPVRPATAAGAAA